MKTLKTVLILLIGLFLLYYYGWQNKGAHKSQPPPPPPRQTPAPALPQQATYPDSMADRLLPVWPPAPAGEQSVPLADSLLQQNLVLIMDGSGSMAQRGCSGERFKFEVARDAVIKWAKSVPVDANLGLIVFDQRGFGVKLPLGTNNRDRFATEIDNIQPNNSTPLGKALNTAYTMLTAQARRQLGYGDYTVVIVTDGIADDINALTAMVNKVLATSPIMIHTIGFCIDANHTLNKTGRTSYRAANNPEELSSGLQDILAESETFDITGFE